MHFWSDTRLRTIVIVSLLSSVLGFCALVGLARYQGLDPVHLTGDSKAYVILANNIIYHDVYSVSPSEPFHPESFRSPGYPAFLSLLFTIVPWPLVALFVHALVSGFAPILLYLFARNFHERAAFWAAVLFSLDPVRLFLAASFLTDSLFVVLFFASLVALEKGKESRKYLIVSALFLGLAILVRPIAQFLPLLYAAYLLVTIRPMRKAALMGLLLIALAYLVVAPWAYRNHRLFDSWNVSSVGTANLAIYNAPEFLKWSPNPEAEARLAAFQAEQAALPYHEALSLARSDVFVSTFRDVIRGHEISYVFFHLVKTIPFFITDGLRDTIRLFQIDIGAMPNISGALMRGDVALLLTYLLSGGLPIALLVLGSGFWTLATLLFATESVRALIRRDLFLLFLTLLVCYFALLTGPVSNARYRLPIEGLIFFLSTLEIYWWHSVRRGAIREND